MRVGLLAVDSTFPNLALMKVAAYHKSKGDEVEWFDLFGEYDELYMTKVFTFTPDYDFVINNVNGKIHKGGTGYNIKVVLPNEIDSMQPDYSIYPQIDIRTSYGFLTRGCIRKCPWCIVPIKEGAVHPYMDIDEITQNGERPYAVLMDNNVLACDYGVEQIQKIIDRGYHVDFNQALDARLVTDDIAKLLAKVKWIKLIRFGCDTKKQIEECEQAIDLIRKYGYRGEFFLYCILIDFKESYERVSHWRKDHKVSPYAQPYRDFSGEDKVPQWQLDMARWVNMKAIFRKCDFKDYSPRKGMSCKEYFNLSL